jgi:hypothetical protein
MFVIVLAKKFGAGAVGSFDLDGSMVDAEPIMQKRVDQADQFRAAMVFGGFDTDMARERYLLRRERPDMEIMYIAHGRDLADSAMDLIEIDRRRNSFE